MVVMEARVAQELVVDRLVFREQEVHHREVYTIVLYPPQ